MLNAEDIKAGVPIATLGSIGILVASFLEKASFIIDYNGSLPSTFSIYFISGLKLILSSASYLWNMYLSEPRPKWLYDLFFELPLGFGLLGFFASTIITLIVYFS